MAADRPPSFSSRFDSQFSFGKDGHLTGRAGLNVLDDLIAGIDEFMAAAAVGRKSARDAGPAMLGAFMWLDDPELLKRIADCPHACVAFTKQPRPFPQARLARLRDALDRCPGFPAAALPELETLALRDEFGRPQLVGPSTRLPQLTIPALRTVGHRRAGGRLVPLLHAKMVLLGNLRWHDEDDLGYPAETLSFWPRRLWIGSANGTTASRLSLEFGCWQAEPELLRQAKRFLTQVIAHSEDLDPDSDNMDPDLVEVEFDDEAMAEAMGELSGFLDEDDEPN
jgi:hypothetical protein